MIECPVCTYRWTTSEVRHCPDCGESVVVDDREECRECGAGMTAVRIPGDSAAEGGEIHVCETCWRSPFPSADR